MKCENILPLKRLKNAYENAVCLNRLLHIFAWATYCDRCKIETNSVDPDQTVQSELDLYCLPKMLLIKATKQTTLS